MPIECKNLGGKAYWFLAHMPPRELSQLRFAFACGGEAFCIFQVFGFELSTTALDGLREDPIRTYTWY